MPRVSSHKKESYSLDLKAIAHIDSSQKGKANSANHKAVDGQRGQPARLCREGDSLQGTWGTGLLQRGKMVVKVRGRQKGTTAGLTDVRIRSSF